MECIQFEYENRYIEDFIKLAYKLYYKDVNMQDDDEVKQLLKDRHILSKYFKLNKFCIYKDGIIAGRFVITEYESDDTAYIGFFECIDDEEVSRFLFDKAYEFAKKNKFSKIIGPVDSSFWIRYRLKTNLFYKRPYTSEPYNKAYYLKLFLNSGYEIVERYTSSIYSKLPDEFEDERYIKRYEDFKSKSYTIISPSIENWDKLITEIHSLLTDLYSDFPMYKPIFLEDFKEYFNSYKRIINMDMVKMAYYNKEAVGFYISIPNYNNLVYHTNKLVNIFKIFKLKNKPKEYVMLYMGVKNKHKGLGKALVQSIIDELKKNKLPSIGALQRQGNITQSYVKEMVQDYYEYVLLKKEVL